MVLMREEIWRDLMMVGTREKGELLREKGGDGG